MTRVIRASALVSILASLLVPGSLQAGSYGDGDISEVGVAVFPFEVESGEDRSMAFALEANLQRGLPGLINQPVYTGRETNRALDKSIGDCTGDRFCIRLFGNQFHSSLAVRVQVFRVGDEVQVETEWFTTGNGLRVGRENTAFPEDNPDALVEAFAAWWEMYWDTSLRVKPDSRVQEGGVLDDSRRDSKDWYGQRDEKKQKRRDDAGKRREDFDSSRDDDSLFDRNDPTADLRDIASGRDSKRDRSSSRDRDRDRRRDDRSNRDRDEAKPYGSDDELAREGDLDDDMSGSRDDRRSTSTTGRRTPTRRTGKSGSDASSRRATNDNLDSSGLSRREQKRFEKSGLTLGEYEDRRYALKKRFYLRAGGAYAGGYLMRRYFVFAFVRTGGVKTEEYGWESLGALAASGGGTFGVGFAPADFLGIEVDVSALAAQQSLRWEYEGHDIGTNATDNGGAGPDAEDQGVMHVAIDIRARAFVFPKRRFKLTPGLGVSMLIMTGFKITPTPPLNFSSRPDTVVVGITPVFGFNYAFSPFVSLFADFSGTIYLDSGAADDEFHDFFGGGTTSEVTPQFLEPRIMSRPIMGRAVVGVMLNF